MSPVITVQDLRKVYRSVRRRRGLAWGATGLFSPEIQTREAVAGLSFAVCEGERVAIFGPNGAGKSTTLKMHRGLRAEAPTRRTKDAGLRSFAILLVFGFLVAALVVRHVRSATHAHGLGWRRGTVS